MINWLGTSSTNIDDAANWQGGALPTAIDDVTIDQTTAPPFMPETQAGTGITCATLTLITADARLAYHLVADAVVVDLNGVQVRPPLSLATVNGGRFVNYLDYSQTSGSVSSAIMWLGVGL